MLGIIVTNDTPKVAAPFRVVLCKFCRREVTMKQQKERGSGVVIFMWNCPQHGSLKVNDVDKGYMFRR